MTFQDPFQLHKTAWPRHPVVISVPHAGRNYPPEMQALSRLSADELVSLEDRYADALVGTASAAGFSTITAQTPRAWIDLNRGETEYDPSFVDGRHIGHPLVTAKVRGGLGIIPSRISPGQDIWKRRIDAAAFEARLSGHYRPYHTALSTMLSASLSDFGIAILIDIHSMPPISARDGSPAAQLVIGDLFGKSSDTRFTDIVRARAEQAGLEVAVNVPYAGGHILARHSSKARNIHALQIEIDRSLYLDDARDKTSPGLATIQRLILNIANDISATALSPAIAIAAE